MARARTGILTPGLKGRIGNAVFVELPIGAVVRGRPLVTAKPTAAQRTARERFTQAAAGYQTLTPAQAQAWREYARTLDPKQAEGGRSLGPSGQQVYTRYANKILQIDSQAEVPSTPPAGVFPGDGVRILAERTAAGVRFHADAANRPGVVTELLAQRLASPLRRTYLEKYRTLGFHAFDENGDSVDYSLTPGTWAFAFRFVEAATGRTTLVYELGQGN